MVLVLGYHGLAACFLETNNKIRMAATIEKLREILAMTSNELAFEVNVTDSLHSQGVDSLDLMDFYLNIEDEYGIQIPDTDVDSLLSIEDFVTYVNGKL